jgi:hypothetical protein
MIRNKKAITTPIIINYPSSMLVSEDENNCFDEKVEECDKHAEEY